MPRKMPNESILTQISLTQFEFQSRGTLGRAAFPALNHFERFSKLHILHSFFRFTFFIDIDHFPLDKIIR